MRSIQSIANDLNRQFTSQQAWLLAEVIYELAQTMKDLARQVSGLARSSSYVLENGHNSSRGSENAN